MRQVGKIQCPVPRAHFAIDDGRFALVRRGDEVLGQRFADLLRRAARGPVAEVILLSRKRKGGGGSDRANDMRTLISLLCLALLSLSVSACAAPIQNGGVVVRPGAEARLDVMCRYRAGSPQEGCAVEEQ